MSYGTTPSFPSKKAMQEALDAGFEFTLFDTSLIGNRGVVDPKTLGRGQSVGPIVGPDVFRNRKWYAKIENKNGKLKVS